MDTITQGMPTYRYAGFWIRLVAFAIDFIILMIIGHLFLGGNVIQFSFDPNTSMLHFNYDFTGLKSLVPLLYIFLFWGFFGATPGKFICKLRIIGIDGKKITWAKSFLRTIGYIISSLVFCLGFIWIAPDSKKQGWHDKIAKTYVIRK